MGRMSKVAHAVMLAGVLAVSCAAPRPALSHDLEQVLATLMAEHGTVGLAVVVVRGGEVVYSNSLGWKDSERELPLKADDLFRIASISKSFAATAVLQLVEQDRVSLDDDVGELLGFPVRNPDFPDKPVTLRMLLVHTSSITDRQRYNSLDIINPATNDSWDQSYSGHAPGTRYEYSNLGYNMVGAIIEQVSGIRFDAYVRQYLLEPLDLDGGHWVDALDADRFAMIYRHGDEGFVRSDAAYAPLDEQLSDYRMGYSTPVFSPTGGLKISAPDLARYMRMHMEHGELDGVRIISSESARLMQSPLVRVDEDADYGLALRIDRKMVPGSTQVGHTGSAYGLYSSMFFDADRKYGFIVITNGTRDPEVRTAVNRALHTHFITPQVNSRSSGTP